MSGHVTTHTATGMNLSKCAECEKPGTKVCKQHDAIQRRQETSLSTGASQGHNYPWGRGEDRRMERKHWEDSGRWSCSASWSDDAGDKSDFSLWKFIKPGPYDMCAFLCEYYTLVESIFRNAVNNGLIHFISLIILWFAFFVLGIARAQIAIIYHSILG